MLFENYRSNDGGQNSYAAKDPTPLARADKWDRRYLGEQEFYGLELSPLAFDANFPLNPPRSQLISWGIFELLELTIKTVIYNAFISESSSSRNILIVKFKCI